MEWKLGNMEMIENENQRIAISLASDAIYPYRSQITRNRNQHRNFVRVNE